MRSLYGAMQVVTLYLPEILTRSEMLNTILTAYPHVAQPKYFAARVCIHLEHLIELAHLEEHHRVPVLPFEFPPGAAPGLQPMSGNTINT